MSEFFRIATRARQAAGWVSDEREGDPMLNESYVQLLWSTHEIATASHAIDMPREVHEPLGEALDSIAKLGERYNGSTDAERAARLLDMLASLKDARLYVTRAPQDDDAAVPQAAAAKVIDLIDVAASRTQLIASVYARMELVLAEVEESRRQIAEEAEKAEKARLLAQAAASDSGTTALEKAFEKLARGEGLKATIWRAATIVVLAGIVGVGLFYVFESAGRAVQPSQLIYRLAIISGLAALAAYLARQAAHHRRVASWAQAIDVQLGSFRAFVENIGDQKVQDAMYEIFGRRVLGPPPEAGKSSDELGTLVQPLLDQVVRRSGA